MILREHDVEVEGVRVHYWEGGQGFPLLLIHGSGPGASTIGNWRLVLEPLASRYHVIAADLVGFGQSGRKPQPPYFDLELWLRQARAMLDLFEERHLGVLGHSISGALALRLAASDERIVRAMTTGCMGARFTANEHTVRTWTFPETRDELRRAGESLVYDKGLINDAYLDGRMNVLHGGDYADYFRSMFAGDKQAYIDASVIPDETLQKISCPVLMVHGKDDRPFPFEETSLALARRIPTADVVALTHCGHSPALEYPAKLVHLAQMIFG